MQIRKEYQMQIDGRYVIIAALERKLNDLKHNI